MSFFIFLGDFKDLKIDLWLTIPSMKSGDMFLKKIRSIGKVLSLKAMREFGQINNNNVPPQKQHIETLKLKEWSSFFLAQTATYECFKPPSDGFVWAHWDKMHVINFWGWGFEILLRTFWFMIPPLLEHFLLESPLFLSELRGRKSQKHAECFNKMRH